jgi:hypothetical protein
LDLKNQIKKERKKERKKKLLRRFETVFSSYILLFNNIKALRGTSISTFKLKKGTKGHFNFLRGVLG